MRQPTWEQIHAVKVKQDEAAIDRAMRGDAPPARKAVTVRRPTDRLLGGGGASGGMFCFIDLLPEPEDFTPSRQATLRREGLRLADR